MKILFVIHDFLPSHQAGAEIYTYLLAKELSKKHEICLFFTEFTPLPLSYKVTKRTFNGLQCFEVFRPFKTDLLGEPYNDKKMENIFQTVLDEFKPDILHLQHLLYHSLRYPEISKQNHIPVLFTLHDYWLTCPRWGQRLQGNLEICHTVDWTKCADCLYEKPKNSNGLSLQSFYHLFRQKISRSRTSKNRIDSLRKRNSHVLAAIENVDLFTAPSPFLRNEFIKHGIPEEKIIFSDNGFDTTNFKKQKIKKDSLIRFGFIGTLCEHKGVHVLIEAFNQIPENKAQLHIYGNQDWFPEYNSKLHKMVRSPAVFFEGLIQNDEVANILSKIDILVVPSIWFENSPLTIHEAFMAGVPVITSAIGGMADLVTDGVNGLLFTVGNSTELTKTMIRIIESGPLLDQLREGIPAVKSIQENGREMEHLYEKLLNKKRAVREINAHQNSHNRDKQMNIATTATTESSARDCELSIVLPCLNEAETLTSCITKANAFLYENDVSGEIIVADNGSTDGSQSLARKLGAQVVSINVRGYGSALQGGIMQANGTYVIMADADDSYDLYTLMPILAQLRKGYDLVMGNRFSGSIKPGAMPPLHRYLGNPVLSFIGRLFFHPGIRDFHCGLRGFNRKSILNLRLCTLGMEFASEMVVKASFQNLSITEVPITLYPDGRTRAPHLKSWRDGWRHLRFLLMFSPRWLFLYPGICLVSLGILGMTLLVKGPLQIGNISIGIHTLLLSGAAVLSGTQSISFAFLAKQFAINAGLLPQDKKIERLQSHMSLEILLIVGFFTIATGTGCILYSIFLWSQVQFGALAPERMMRILVPAVTMTAVGMQIVITAFFKSILALKTRSA